MSARRLYELRQVPTSMDNSALGPTQRIHPPFALPPSVFYSVTKGDDWKMMSNYSNREAEFQSQKGASYLFIPPLLLLDC